jgi:regulator of sigma E protease
MDFLTTIVGYGTSLLSYLVPFLVVLTIVVFFHELGHFAVARLFKTQIDVFSIGFGREIVGWYDRSGTRWRISWLPLGGYVKFFGDDNAASTPDLETLAQQESAMTDEERASCFHFKPLYQRTLVVVAGPIANFILAIFIFAFLFSVIGDRILTAQVDKIQPGSAAEEVGLQVGDVITQINGTKINTFSDLKRIVSLSADTPIDLVVRRGEEFLEFTATPKRGEQKDQFGNVHRLGLLGVSREVEGKIERVRYNPVVALWKGAQETWFIIDRTFLYIGRMFAGKEDTDQLGGPLRIAQYSGQVASIGPSALLNLCAILSASIGLINLFPIPMLDGGHLLYYGYEAVVGKPLNERAQEFGFRVGLALVLCLMIFATWNDLVHLPIFNGITGFFL